MGSVFAADVVPQAPEDPLFGLMTAYRADSFEKKVDLGIGAYRDDNAKPWVLPVVKKVSGIKLFQFLNYPNFTSRRTTSSVKTPTLTTNISPSAASPNSPPRHRN